MEPKARPLKMELTVYLINQQDINLLKAIE
jgi:hypothetical protein